MLGPDFNDKDPTQIAWTTYLWVWLVSSLGAIAGHIDQLRRLDEKRREQRRRAGLWFVFVDLIADMMTGAFVGVMVFYALEAYHAPTMISGTVIGVTASMSSKMMEWGRTWIAKRLGKIT